MPARFGGAKRSPGGAPGGMPHGGPHMPHGARRVPPPPPRGPVHVPPHHHHHHHRSGCLGCLIPVLGTAAVIGGVIALICLL